MEGCIGGVSGCTMREQTLWQLHDTRGERENAHLLVTRPQLRPLGCFQTSMVPLVAVIVDSYLTRHRVAPFSCYMADA